MLKICLGFLTIVCLIACNKHMAVPFTKNCDASVCSFPLVSTDIHTTIHQDNWKFSLIGNGWDTAEFPLFNIKTVNKNEGKNCSISFIKEPTSDTYSQYVIATIRQFADQYNHINEIDQVIVNGNKFVKVQISNDTSMVWSWLSVKNGFGYQFNCGGDVDQDADSNNLAHDLCQEVANSVEIK